jgi:hypothetical protein
MENDKPGSDELEKSKAGLTVADPSKVDHSFELAAGRWWEAQAERRNPGDRGYRDQIDLIGRTVAAFGPDTPISSMDAPMFKRVRATLLAAPSVRGGRSPSLNGRRLNVNRKLRIGMVVLEHAARTRPDIDLSNMPDPASDKIYL